MHQRPSVANSLAAVDLAAIRAALARAHFHAPGEQAHPAPIERSHVSGLERRLKQRDAELAAAIVERDGLKTEVARMRARLD